MAYTNATFYLDLVNGSDAARAGLTPTAYANNGSGLVRVTVTSHGLVTGAIVDITGTTGAIYNGAWKITRIDANNFDLQTSTYSSNPASKGTVTPRGGSSWSDAWLTNANGPTASRTQAGDTIRYAKSGDPTSIGNATWTSLSPTVTLATAQTTTIDNCETAWTAANGSTVIRNSSGSKQGTYTAQITLPAAPAINTKYAYFTLPATLNLSAYQQITFWYFFTGTMVDANRAAIKLCSDTTGDTAVDTFAFPANTGATNVWVPLTITKTGGGNLGSSINSIAFYSGSSAPPASQVFTLDNFSACTTNGLNLSSLISKNSSAYTNPTSSDTWHGIQSIDGTTVVLANYNSLATGTTGLKGYYTTGTSPATVTTYIRPTIKLPYAITSALGFIINKSGSAGSLITYSGGWNTSTDTQDGDTWIDGQTGAYVGVQGFNINYWKIDRLNFTRFSNAYSNGSSTSSVGCEISTIVTNSTGANMQFSSSTLTVLTNNNNGGLSGAITSPENFNLYCPSLITRNNVGSPSMAGNNAVIDYFEVVNCLGAAITTANSTMNIGTMVLNNLTNALQALDGGNGSSSRFYIDNLTMTNCTNAFSSVPLNLTVSKLTASGITNMNASYNLVVKNLNASTSQIVGSAITTNPRTYQPTAFYSNVNNVQTDNRAYWSYGNALSQTTTRHTASGVAWQINITDTSQTSTFPVYYPIAQVACNAGTTVTVKAWVLKSHATDIAAQLLLKAYEIAGVTANVTAAKSNDTNWEELTISFTPTIKGVAQIYLSAWWVANAASQSVYVDDITVTQA